VFRATTLKIDIAHVSRRFKFVTVRYGRLDESSTADGAAKTSGHEALDAPVVHTTVVYVPDVWNLQPTADVWTAQKGKIAARCQSTLADAESAHELVQQASDSQLAVAAESVAQRQAAVEAADTARNKVTH